MDPRLPRRPGGSDLFKRIIPVAPERSPPAFVDFFDGTVPLPQPSPERVLAERTEALASEFICDVPQKNSRMRPEPFRQGLVDRSKSPFYLVNNADYETIQ